LAYKYNPLSVKKLDYYPTSLENLTATNLTVTNLDVTNIVSTVSFVGASTGLSFGELHTHDNSTPTAVATGTTYTKFDQWQNNGVSNNCTVDANNNKITITTAGKYFVTGSFSASSSVANINILGSVFLGGAEQDHIHFTRKIATANDIGSMNVCGILDVASVPVDLDFRMRHSSGGSVNITMVYSNLSIMQCGG